MITAESLEDLKVAITKEINTDDDTDDLTKWKWFL